MAMYEYKCVPGPIGISGNIGKNTHKEAVALYENLINANASEGWEFVQIDSIESELKPGCLGGLLGQKADRAIIKLLVFKRPIT